MLTAKWITHKQYDLDHKLTDLDKQMLLEENKDGNFSYLCLLKEMLRYQDVTVESLLNGWGGIKIVKF